MTAVADRFAAALGSRRGADTGTDPRDEPHTVSQTAANGRTFVFAVVLAGQRHGRHGCLTHGGADPLVEVFDATYPGMDSPHGQMVSSYYLSTLLDGGSDRGIDFHMGVPEWSIDQAAWAVVHGKLAAATGRPE